MYTLNIKPENNEVKTMYENHGHFNDGDSGIDLFTPKDIEIMPGETKLIDLEIKCSMNESLCGSPVSYLLHPRSSIVKTPLILHNSTGIIDAGYRGNIKAAIHHLITKESLKRVLVGEGLNPYIIKKGSRLVQICSPLYNSIKMNIVKELDITERGEGGFGSTGI